MSTTQRLRLAHRVRGRVRFEVEGSRRKPHALDAVRKAIARIDGVRQVEVHPATGSIIVHYDPSLAGKFRDRLQHQGESTGAFQLEPPAIGEGGELMRNIQEEAEFLAEHSETAAAILEYFRGLDGSLKRATGNLIDLKVVLPLVLAVYSALEIGLEASTPLWVTLGIFSFNSFVALHRPYPVSHSLHEAGQSTANVSHSPSPATHSQAGQQR